jgi:hypothetical protein
MTGAVPLNRDTQGRDQNIGSHERLVEDEAAHANGVVLVIDREDLCEFSRQLEFLLRALPRPVEADHPADLGSLGDLVHPLLPDPAPAATEASLDLGGRCHEVMALRTDHHSQSNWSAPKASSSGSGFRFRSEKSRPYEADRAASVFDEDFTCAAPPSHRSDTMGISSRDRCWRAGLPASAGGATGLEDISTRPRRTRTRPQSGA